MKTFQDKYKEKIDSYQKVFNLDDLNDANDKSNLEIMIKTEIMIDDIQEKIAALMEDEDLNRVGDVKKLHDLLRDATNTITTLQKTLNIDRKTRKSEETTSVADYLRALRRNAKEFMDARIINFWCPDCKVLVGRIYPVHEHTAFSVSFQCSQCKKMIRGRREEKDVLFDVKDRNWRKDRRAEIIQAKTRTSQADDDELYLGETTELVLDAPNEIEQAVIEDEVELFNGTDETTD